MLTLKKVTIFRIVFFLFLLAHIVQHNALADTTYFRVSAQDTSAPKFIKPDVPGKKVTGLCIDLFAAIENIDHSLKFEVSEKLLPLSRIMQMTESNSLDVICGMLKSAERSKKFIFLDTPLFDVSYHLIINANDQINISSWEEVKSLEENGIVLTTHNLGGVIKLTQIGVTHVDSSATSIQSNLRKLKAGRGRFFFHRFIGANAIVNPKEFGNEIRVLEKPVIVDSFFIAASKELAPEKIIKLNTAINKLSKNGSLKKIADKYTGH